MAPSAASRLSLNISRDGGSTTSLGREALQATKRKRGDNRPGGSSGTQGPSRARPLLPAAPPTRRDTCSAAVRARSRSPLTAERRRLQRGPRGAVDDFDGAARGHGQDGVERRVVAQAAEPVGVAAQAAVPQQQPLAGARTGTGPRRRRRRGAGGRRSHLRGRRRRRPQDKRPTESRSLTVPGAAAASHHPGPGRGGKGERPREREVTQPRRMRNRAAAARRGAGARGRSARGGAGAGLRMRATTAHPRWLRSRGAPGPGPSRPAAAISTRGGDPGPRRPSPPSSLPCHYCFGQNLGCIWANAFAAPASGKAERGFVFHSPAPRPVVF